MRYFITFSYNGSHFNGFQTLKNYKTVQEELEKALQKINNNQYVKLVASGRTDKGVHALGQTAHFDLSINITPYKLKIALNSYLNNEIHIINIKEVNNDFHARYNVVSKEYKYIINLGEFNPIEKDYVYQLSKKLNIEKIEQAMKLFIGKHNFRNFCKDDNERENCVRNIFDINLFSQKGKIIFNFCGNGFLRHMIRNIIGILLDVGLEKINIDDIEKIIDYDRYGNIDIKHKAPSCGLYLVKVNY